MGSDSAGIEEYGGNWSQQRDTVEQLAQIGTWRWCPESGELAWSANLFRIFGLEPGEAAPSAELIVSTAAPDERARVNDELRLLADGVQRPPIDYRLIRSDDGTTRWVRAKSVAVDNGATGARWLCGVVQDITEQAWAEQETGVHHALGSALAQWESLETGGPRLLAGLGRAIGFDLGMLWTPRDRYLIARAVWSDGIDSSTSSYGLRLRRGEGLAGRVWDTEKVQGVLVADHERAVDLAPGESFAGLQTAVGLPALAPDRDVVAVLSFAARRRLEVTDRLAAVLAEVGSEIGTFLSRRRSQLQQSALSARELQILQLSAQGLSMTEIAEQLAVSRSTVKSHLDHIYRKLRVSGRTSAVAEMMRQGVIT
jgi:PAS domain S-box-containing protein